MDATVFCRTWRDRCLPCRSNGFAVERHDPVAGRREGRGATLAHARGVTDPDDGRPGGAVPAGPPTSTRAFKRCAVPSGPNAGTVTTGSCPFQLLVVPRPSSVVPAVLWLIVGICRYSTRPMMFPEKDWRWCGTSTSISRKVDRSSLVASTIC